jgi:hypothetical protein
MFAELYGDVDGVFLVISMQKRLSLRREDAYSFLLSRMESFCSVALYYYTSASLLYVLDATISSRSFSVAGRFHEMYNVTKAITGTAVHEQNRSQKATTPSV